MDKIPIDDRASYELYIKAWVKTNLKISGLREKTMRALIMQAFDDGITYNQGNLKVEVT